MIFNINPVLFQIGIFQIRYYSVLILIAIAITILMIIKEGKRFNYSKDDIFDIAFWTIIFAILGARLYYVIFNFSLYKGDITSIFKIWEGGLAIHGGIICGMIAIYVVTKKKKFDFIRILDMIAVPMLLAQAIGRWGNFFNSEAHGAVTTLEHLQSLHIPNFIINGMNIDGLYYVPTFLYESLWCLLGFIFLLIIRRLKFIKKGFPTAIYFIWYGIGRFFIESLRTDSLMLGNFKAAQIISIIMIATGLVYILLSLKKGKYEDLYNKDLDETVKIDIIK